MDLIANFSSRSFNEFFLDLINTWRFVTFSYLIVNSSSRKLVALLFVFLSAQLH